MSPSLDGYRIERMSRADLDRAIDWAAAEGWNPGLYDAACFHAVDPHGFFMGALDGRMIASGSAPIYDETFAFIGLYIVVPEQRGRGYGMALTRAMLDYVGERNVGLDGVEAMAEKYARLGFRTAHRSVRHAFTTPIQARAIAPGIVKLAEIPFADIAAYDRRHFFAPRDAFLRSWIAQPRGIPLGFLADGQLAGYAVLRKCRNGNKIGPLFADTPQVAASLLDALCVHAPGEQVFIDIPEPNRAGGELAARYDMRPDFTCYRMYLRGDPGLPLDSIYGITSFEAG